MRLLSSSLTPGGLLRNSAAKGPGVLARISSSIRRSFQPPVALKPMSKPPKLPKLLRPVFLAVLAVSAEGGQWTIPVVASVASRPLIWKRKAPFDRNAQHDACPQRQPSAYRTDAGTGDQGRNPPASGNVIENRERNREAT